MPLVSLLYPGSLLIPSKELISKKVFFERLDLAFSPLGKVSCWMTFVAQEKFLLVELLEGVMGKVWGQWRVQRFRHWRARRTHAQKTILSGTSDIDFIRRQW